MHLPPDFTLSASALQDFADCAQRFYLRYVAGRRWPALQVADVLEHERRLQWGEQFHLLAHQHQLGLPLAALNRHAQSEPLATWWRNYLAHAPRPAGQVWSEVTLHCDFEGYRLMAKFDRLMWDGERALILDWKTTPQPTPRATLQRRLQTLVYPLALAEAGPAWLGAPIQPEAISMMYWFPAFPAQAVAFPYSAAHHAEARARLSALLARLHAADPAWDLRTANEQHCRFCGYRSLCARGAAAGPLADLDDDLSTLDFDALEAIEL